MKISNWYKRDARVATTEVSLHRLTLANGETTTGLWMTFVDAEGRHIAINFTAGEFSQLMAEGARAFGIEALVRAVHKTMPVHILAAGRAICDAQHKYPFPKDWPAGHTWVREEDRALATCKTCLGEIDWQQHPEFAEWEMADYKELRLVAAPDCWAIYRTDGGRDYAPGRQGFETSGPSANIEAAKASCLSAADKMAAGLGLGTSLS